MALLGLGPGAAAVPADTQGWTFVRELDDGIRIFRRSPPGQPTDLPEVRVRVQATLPLGALRSVLTDYGHVVDFIPHLKRSSVVRAGPGWVLLRQRLALPPVLAEREYMIRIETGEDAGSWHLRWVQVPLPAPPRDAVEPRGLWGSWRLEPRTRGTQVTYTVFMDPGGRIPQWLVRLGMDGYLPEVVRAVLARARSGGRMPVAPHPGPPTLDSRVTEGR